MAKGTVLNAPVRLMSIMSAQVWSSISQTEPGVQMLALATTMSIFPNVLRARSVAARMSADDRTSPTNVSTRRPAAVTSLAVSARSSGVLSGYATLATGPHRSTATMSAPSAAGTAAGGRPCPAAAPVIRASLPSSLPATLHLAMSCRTPDPASCAVRRVRPQVYGIRASDRMMYSSYERCQALPAKPAVRRTWCAGRRALTIVGSYRGCQEAAPDNRGTETGYCEGPGPGCAATRKEDPAFGSGNEDQGHHRT